MKARLLRQSFIVLGFAYGLMATPDSKDTEIESITGTREPDEITTTETAHAVATTTQSNRESRWYRPAGHERGGNDHDDMPSYHEDHDDNTASMDNTDDTTMVQGKGDYFGGYYDFLINEGSYKFWAVFQLGTAALLIYSGFAALYFAKVNPTDDDYEDYFLRRRRSVDRPPQERNFLGLSPETFQRILDAIAREFH